jgi:hypothetical protein
MAAGGEAGEAGLGSGAAQTSILFFLAIFKKNFN